MEVKEMLVRKHIGGADDSRYWVVWGSGRDCIAWDGAKIFGCEGEEKDKTYQKGTWGQVFIKMYRKDKDGAQSDYTKDKKQERFLI